MMARAGSRIYAEAVRRGLLYAEKVVVLGDGAEWIRNLVELHFPQATQIVDLYHTREHVAALCKSLRGANAILSLRCMFVSGRTEEFWSQRAA